MTPRTYTQADLDQAVRDAQAVTVKPLVFDWEHHPHTGNPTAHRTDGPGYSAYVLIPYEGDNDPAAGTGTWNGVAQNRGKTGFESKQAAIDYCESTIRECARARVDAASRYITATPARAVEAAAYEKIAAEFDSLAKDAERQGFALNYLTQGEYEMAADIVRALITPDHAEALEAVRREARIEAFNEAAHICQFQVFRHNDEELDAADMLACYRCRDAVHGLFIEAGGTMAYPAIREGKDGV